MPTFEQFQLPENLNKALVAMKFIHPTPIQEKAIPLGLSGRDVMGRAQTGTGKTAAFGIPLIVKLIKNPGQTALVLAPTRELAAQIHGVFQQMTREQKDLNPALLIGGLSMKQQLRELSRNPRILIATPGRLCDHLRRKPQLASKMSLLVLDEADRMLDMGFRPQLNTIRKFLPRERQTMMFSATFPSDIKQLASEYLNQPVEASVGETQRPVQKIEQAVIETTHHEKNSRLLNELKDRQGSILIFARTKARTNRLTKFLVEKGQKATRLHGDCTQAQRQNAIESFRSGRIRVLVATDIASRGLDIDGIGHVINYDLPQVPEETFIASVAPVAMAAKADRFAFDARRSRCMEGDRSGGGIESWTVFE